MPSSEFEARLEAMLEANLDEAIDTGPGEYRQAAPRSWSDDPEVRFAQILSRAGADDKNEVDAWGSWLDSEIKRIETEGTCCGKGTHFDKDGVLAIMEELDMADMDQAWKLWHDRTFNLKSVEAEADPDDDRGRTSDAERAARSRQRAMRESAGKITDLEKLKEKYLLKREPVKSGGVYDRLTNNPLMDKLLDRI